MRNERQHILIVDETAVVEGLGKSLHEEQGWNVSYLDSTINARDISQQAAKIPYTALLVEPYLFVMDSPEMRFRGVLESLVEQTRAKKVPIIALTSQNEEDLERSYRIERGKHYDVYLQKPETCGRIIEVFQALFNPVARGTR